MIEFGIIVLVIAAICVGVWYAYIRVAPPQDTIGPAISNTSVTAHKPAVAQFSTPYFKFQAPDKWREIPQESSKTKFVYRAYNGSLVEQDLVVYIGLDSPPETTRVLPVIITGKGLQPTDSITDHCKVQVPEGEKQSRQVTLHRVTMLCDSDGTIFSVLVGREGGSGLLPLLRNTNNTETYTILYRDLSANPMGRDLAEIVRNFAAQ